MHNDDMAIIRRAFAKQVLFTAEVARMHRLEEAFAKIPRENFLGIGPWSIFRHGRFLLTPDNNPIYVYTNDPIAIDINRRINNGQPSLHASLIAAACPMPGDHVVHIGAGTGYYTALLAHMAQCDGKVTAIEYERDLATRAATSLSIFDNVNVIAGDGSATEFESADVIYVNAGVTRPPVSWLERLKDRGRLILPLTTDQGFRADQPEKRADRGAVFRIERRGNEFLAQWISAVEIFPCVGARDEIAEAALRNAFAGGTPHRVTHLYVTGNIPKQRCWLNGGDWCLGHA